MSARDQFNGDKLRLARLIASLSLDELGVMVGASRQFIHQLETNAKFPSDEMLEALAAALNVQNSFFERPLVNPVREEDCHFRRLATAPRGLLAQVAARGTILEMMVDALDQRLRLPPVNFPDFNAPTALDSVEVIAEETRQYWSLGLDGPITNMTRVAEHAGAVVVHFDDISDRIDALSISRRRPIIVRSSAKEAAVRLRFDIAHEIGHLVMHQGLVTGDKVTEDQAHRFASAFLIPRRAFAREFPRSRRNIHWTALYEMKMRWKVSVRAIVRRAFDLGFIDAAQYRTANIHLMKTGQSKMERHDDQIALERSELLHLALKALEKKGPIELHRFAEDLGLTAEHLARVASFEIAPMPHNIVRLPAK